MLQAKVEMRQLNLGCERPKDADLKVSRLGGGGRGGLGRREGRRPGGHALRDLLHLGRGKERGSPLKPPGKGRGGGRARTPVRYATSSSPTAASLTCSSLTTTRSPSVRLPLQSLDSSLKKNQAFIKKCATLGEATKASLLQVTTMP